MTKEELLAALLVERYDNRWWTTPSAQVERETDDSELSTARRRRALADDYEARGA